ncbi:MAG: T9SS type A sorting domain-containing protein [bacterium]|nr:T9SS type A sorting domain-containing protein [bacterium]
MKKFLLALIFFVTSYVYSQPIIINELYNSGGNDEWLELLVVEDSLDLRNWDIRDFSSSGSPQQPLVFSNNSLWSNLKKGTIIIVARPENAFGEDLDPSDFLLVVKSSNAIMFSGNVFLIAGSSEAVQIRNTSQTHIFGVSWGSANLSSLPQPKVHLTGTSSSNTSVYFKEDSLPEILVAANWAMNGAPTMGTGNTANNIAWILSLRAKPEGSGVVYLDPLVASGSTNLNLKFMYKRDIQYNVDALKIIFPEEFTWSQNPAQIVIENFTASVSVQADTINFSNVVFLNDSVSITIQDVTTPTFTGKYKFKFQSGIGSVIDDVNPSPILTVYGAPIPIAQAKENDTSGIALYYGDLVSIRGIVTVANQFGSPSYIQDNSAGISIFGSIFSDSVQIGDEVFVSGTITQFNGLNQLEFPQLHEIISSGNNVDPIIATPYDLAHDGQGGLENFEGRFVRLNGVLVTELNGTPVSNWAYKNYRLTGSSSADTVQIRIDNNTNIIGSVAPAGRFDVVGVLSQYKTSLPFIGGYQVMPRMLTDIISSGPLFEEFPEETYLTPGSITLNWKTINPGTSRVRYGLTTNYELGIIEVDDSLRTFHNITVDGLQTATIYNLQAFSVANSDTSFSGNIISSTSSDFPTTGEINVYFNKNVYFGVSSGVNANQNVDFLSRVVERINNAKRSLDVALYSLSGSVGDNLASAILNAKNRGVSVRVIGEYDTRNSTSYQFLVNNGIAYINDRFGSNDGGGLHHNKFFIIDYRNGAADSVWVITGSWNPTDPGTNDDRQNLIEIQDVALAGAYTVEFNEMWGSNNEVPDPQYSKFSLRKVNNTPHTFIINGNRITSYFSPSDFTTSKIGKAIGNAEKSVNGAILTFTRRDLADSVISVKNEGKKARIILSNNTDTGSQFSYLQSNGVDIRLKGFSDGLLHHKYAIIDAEPYGYPASVITGSHNWSSSAENSNDENTLIIKNDRVANFYLQEFAARYYEAGGIDSILISSVDEDFSVPSSYSLYQNYPNPFNPVTTIRFQLPSRQKVELTVFDILGREVANLLNEEKLAGIYEVKFNASSLASGVYFYRLKTADFIESKKLILIK